MGIKIPFRNFHSNKINLMLLKDFISRLGGGKDLKLLHGCFTLFLLATPRR